ncbi:hypothetical protein ACWKSP_19630 [Micromonosporaceae bacterium Da 78-11]
MGADQKMPGTAVRAGELPRPTKVASDHLDVSEILSDRAAAPSPFGDDQTFPLPVEQLIYTATTRQG